MSPHDTRDAHTGAAAPVAAPEPGVLDGADARPLSWDLGSELTTDVDAHEVGGAGSRRGVTLYRVTDRTAVVRLRTPVGRERFYGVPVDDLPPSLRED